jgi:hypothetical protein
VKLTSFSRACLTLVLLALPLAGCSNPADEFIQGRWQRGNVHFVDEWFFDRGKFSHLSSIDMFNPQVLTGSYTIFESQDGTLTLELYDLEGSFGEDRREIRVQIDREAGTLKIGRETYARVKP